jgi:aryl-alcohol dehydrogenase-like predicted oxidoreductase
MSFNFFGTAPGDAQPLDDLIDLGRGQRQRCGPQGRPHFGDAMIKRAFGSTGLMVSALGLGCNNFGRRLDLEKTRAVVDSAIAAGINFFDTADVYGDRGGSETLFGVTLGTRRKDVILATKFGLPMDDEGRLAGGSRRYVLSAVEASLKRLKTEWIDIYYLAPPGSRDPDRGDTGRARRVGAAGKGQVRGLLQRPRTAVGRCDGGCPDQKACFVRGSAG